MKTLLKKSTKFSNITIYFLLLLLSTNLFSQADLTIGGYYQDFGTSALSWTSGATSGTMQGWYYQAGNNRGNVEISSTSFPAPNNHNSGGIYTYTCNDNAMIGSRAAGSSNANLYYGVRLKNTSGATITQIKVTFDWFQVSLAQNQNNLNTITFSYQTGNVLTSLTTGTWISVPSLDFSNVENDNSGSSAQLQWFPPCQSAYADQRGSKEDCILVNLPPNGEIMLRWYDYNDAANDHHMGIDNVSVIGFPAEFNTTSCASPLAIDLVNFNGNHKNNQTNLYWETLNERDNSYFTIARSQDGLSWENIGRVTGAGNSDERINYNFTDHSPFSGINYYRLQSTDYDGTHYKKGTVAINVENHHLFYNQLTSTIELMQAETVEIYSLDGKLIQTSSGTSSIPFTGSGVFLIHHIEKGTMERIVVNPK